MRQATSQPLPQARAEKLLVQELPDEILVYDLTRHKAFCMNKPAAAVWKHCDGQTPVAEIARLAQEELRRPIDEEIVWLALAQLEQASLLRERVSLVDRREITRRQVLRKIADGVVFALPLVTAVTAPTAAQAASRCNVTSTNCNAATVGCCCSGFTPPRLCVADSSVEDGGVCRSGTSCS